MTSLRRHSTRRTHVAGTVALAALALGPLATTRAATNAPASTLIVNAVLLDGTGPPGRPAAVRLRGDTIAETGSLRPAPGEAVVDAHGLALAPGFIDTHSHGDDGIFAHPDARAAVSQGITTIVTGQDGG